MGHLQSLALPRSRKWRDVVGLISDGASAPAVASRAAEAAERDLLRATRDPAFRACAQMLVELPLAARGPAFGGFLESHGIPLNAGKDPASFLAALSKALDRTAATTDLGEMARGELLAAIATEFERRLPSLFPATPADLRSALGQLAGGKDFAEFAQAFFGGLTSRALSYYLSRELANHTGAGLAFPDDAARVGFEQALEQHGWEAAGIVREFAADWYGKTIWRGSGPTADKVTGFSGFAMRKLQGELARRRDGD